MDELRKTPIQRVLHRENLLMGGEREPMLFLLLATGGLVVTAQNAASIVVALPVYIVGVFLLRRMAKTDPFMTKVYWRMFRTNPYYPPRSTPFVKS